MRPPCIWLATLGMAGVCVSWIGGGPSRVYAGEEKPAPAPDARPAERAPVEAPPPRVDDLLKKAREGKYGTPAAAVNSFLAAVQARDPVELAEATALRAPTEASPKNRPLFTAILEQSLTGDELAELATKLGGFEVVNQKPAIRGGVSSLILRKPGPADAGDVWIIKTRHEKAGWKVVDIGSQGVRDKPILIPRG